MRQGAPFWQNARKSLYAPALCGPCPNAVKEAFTMSQRALPQWAGWRFPAGSGRSGFMTDPKKSDPRAAGGPLALSILAGAIIGVLYHQSTLGLLVGSGLGVVFAVGFWFFDRKR
jgi:hypothetical protein